MSRTMIRHAEKIVRDEEKEKIKARKAKAVAIVENYSNGWRQAQADVDSETLLEKAISRSRCYEEHLTEEEKVDCAKERKHMSYDEEADYGFFE
jgi:spore germination protein YaaH